MVRTCLRMQLFLCLTMGSCVFYAPVFHLYGHSETQRERERESIVSISHPAFVIIIMTLLQF